jgi:hypothetical protein
MHDVKPQLWVMLGELPAAAASQAEKVQAAAEQLRPVVEAAAAQGCRVGLYNHGGWFGEPENQLEVIAALDRPNVGIVYNLHHGHDHVDRLGELLEKAMPHLYAVNLNGMDRQGDRRGRKILPVGQGELDAELLRIIAESGYRGPIGVLGHTEGDAEQTLRANLQGLQTLVAQLKGDATRTHACCIEVVEKNSGWPAPLVELRTVHGLRYVTDNAGRIACDAPELMGRETWFHVRGHGYERPVDGFGNRGVRLTPRPGDRVRVEVERRIIAKRLGRLTGAGLLAESEKLGLAPRQAETAIVGCDSVQNAVYRGKLFWAWGDTSLLHYPLGLYHMTSATTPAEPLPSLEPPLRPRFEYFKDDSGSPRSVAEMPGEGPTWLTGYVSLPDGDRERLVAYYRKIRPPMEAYETGLCVWSDEEARFVHLKTLWRRSPESPKPPSAPDGHPAFFRDEKGETWLLFGDPLPKLRCRATYESWQDPESWEALRPQERLISASDGTAVEPHSGSIAWNGFRKRWVTVFMQAWGKPSAFGELWYAEADTPLGPWGPAVKVLSHDNYTFYNPRLHPELSPEGSSVLLFEGTYTKEFADRPEATPRYDYNQVLYRLDLDDPALAEAQRSTAETGG